MTTVIYKYIDKQYKISDFSDKRSGIIKFIFEEAINGYLVIDDKRYPIHDGICTVDVTTLRDGELKMRIYTSGVSRFAEGLVLKDGRFMRISYGDEYLCELSRRIDSLRLRCETIEAVLSKIEERINMKIQF